MIDELPLDLFDEKQPSAASPAAPAQAAPEATPAPALEPPAPTTGPAPPTATQLRLYDAIGVTGLALVLGLAFRVLGAGALLPVANIVIALLIYYRVRARYRAAYLQQADALRVRLEEERRLLELQPTTTLTREVRLLFDGLAILALAIGLILLFAITGLSRLLPVPWFLLLFAAAGLYLWLGRPWRPAWYTLADRHRRRLTGSSNTATRF